MTYTWLIIAGVLLVLELMTGTFYLLMLALASVLTWLAMLLGAGFLAQAVCFLISASALVYLARRLRGQLNQRTQPNLAENLDAGEVIWVSDWLDGVGHSHYRGTQWGVIMDTPDATEPQDGHYRIVRLDGTRIRVTPMPTSLPTSTQTTQPTP